MLGKFKSLFSKEPLVTTLNEIPAIVAGEQEKVRDDRLEERRTAADMEIRRLQFLVQQLSQKRAGDNYATILKDRFCERSLKLLTASGATISSAHQAALQEMGDISIKELRHLQAYKEDMGLIASQIKTAQDRASDFTLAYDQSSRKRLDTIRETAEQIEARERAARAIDGELEEVAKAIPFIQETLERDERRLGELVKSIEAIEIDTRARAATLESERSIIRQRVGTEFGSASRILKRLEHDQPKKYRVLSLYITNPGEAFIDDEDLEIRTILEDLRPTLRQTDPEGFEKVQQLLRDLDFFDSIREQYRGLTAKIQEIRDAAQQEILPLEKERNHAALSRDEARQELTQLAEKQKTKQNERTRLAQEIAEGRTRLVAQLQELTGREVQLA